MQTQIARKTEKFVTSLGLNVENVKKATNKAALCVIENTRVQAVRAMKHSGAKVRRVTDGWVAVMPNGGIVSIAVDETLPRADRVVSLLLENDADHIYCATLANAMQERGYKLNVNAVRDWFDGDESRGAKRAARMFRNFLGRHRYDFAEDNSKLTATLEYALGLSKQKKVDGVDVSITDEVIVANIKAMRKAGLH